MNAFRLARDIAFKARVTSGPLPAPATHKSLEIQSVARKLRLKKEHIHSVIGFWPFQQSLKNRLLVIGVLDRILFKGLIRRTLQIICQRLKARSRMRTAPMMITVHAKGLNHNNQPEVGPADNLGIQ